MTKQRLNHAIVPYIHKGKLDLLDLNSICFYIISVYGRNKHYAYPKKKVSALTLFQKNQNRKILFGYK